MNRKDVYNIFLKAKNVIMLIFIPVIFTFILGSVYSKIYVEKIPMAVLDMDNSSLSRSITDMFNKSPGFKVEYYVQSDEELNELIKNKKTYTGLIIPKNFKKDVSEMKAPKTLLIIDETNLVVGNNALSYGSAILNTLNAGVQLNVLEGKGMTPYSAEKAVGAMSFVERMLYDPHLSYMRYLFYGILGIFVQQTYLGVIAPMLIEERARMIKLKLRSKKGVRKLVNLGGRVLGIIALSVIGITLSTYLAGKYFSLPLRGSIINFYILLGVFILDLTAVALILSSIFGNPVHCVQFSMFLSIPTVLTSGYVWPDYMMPGHFASIVKAIWPLGYFINPLRIINLKGVGLEVIYPYIKGGLYYAAVWMFLGISLYILKLLVAKRITRRYLIEENMDKIKPAQSSI